MARDTGDGSVDNLDSCAVSHEDKITVSFLSSSTFRLNFLFLEIQQVCMPKYTLCRSYRGKARRQRDVCHEPQDTVTT